MKSFFEILFVFAKVGLITFGGGYAIVPILQKEIIAKRQWVEEADLIDYYAIAQCLPGIIAANTAMIIGYKRKGIWGMLAAAIGIAIPSFVIILIIAMFIHNFMQYEIVTHAFNGIRAAVLALITGAAIKMCKNGVKDIFGVWIFIVTLLVLIIFNISPIITIIAAAVCGIIIKEVGTRRKK
jgi:chromate transporter